MIYNKNIVMLVIDIYGESSKIYRAIMCGEKISKLVKESYKAKGCKTYRIKDKKHLFEECKKCEQALEASAQAVNL